MSEAVPRRRRWPRRLALGLGLAALAGGVWSVRVMLPRATGYAAKIGCSATLVTGRSLEQVADEELAALGFVALELDESHAEVRASVFGLAEQRARHFGRHGCMLVDDAPPELAIEPRSPRVDPRPWPLGEGEDRRPDPAGLDRAGLERVLAAAFEEPDPEQPRRTRAVLVAWQGRLLGERYAEGIGRDTPLPGWSMAKSLTNAMVGLLVREGELDLHAPAPIREWSEADDPRAAITLDHLLRMSSGLEFAERYGPFGEGSDMLFVDDDAAARAIAKPLVAEPGSVYAYSSGTANIVARVVGDCFADADAQREFVERELFEPLAIRTAVLELDRAGNFVGSSFALMSARDWARLGQLYLEGGTWQGRAILPAGWVDYTRTPAPACREGEYGALFQTNGGRARLPSIPDDAFEMVGHEGQSVLIVPSRQAVIVRLGLTQGSRWDTDAFAAEVLATLP
ncbi:serine hydrolase domain-containing protein [Nannocystaceae bacterium ST9]